MAFKLLQGTSDVPINAPTEESLLGKVGRGTAQTVARTAGALGGIISAPTNIALGAANYLTGGRTPTLSQIKEKVPRAALSFFAPILSAPTEEEIRGGFSKLTGGYTEPRTSVEEFYGDVVSDLASLAIPIKGKFPTTLKSIGKLAAQSLAGNVASKGAQSLGAGQLGQTAAKIGTMGVAGLLGGRKALRNQMNESYKLQEAITEGKVHDSSKLNSIIDSIATKVEKGDFPSKDFIKDRISSIKKLSETSGLVDKAGRPLTKSTISVQDAVRLKQGLNEWFTDYSIPHKAQRHLGKIIQPLNEFLEDYGKINPEFGKEFFKAEDIYKGLNDFSKATQFLDKHINLDSIKSPVAKAILIGSGWYSGKIPQAIGLAGAGVGAREAAKFFDLLRTSKTARDIYGDLFKSALKGSASSVSRDISKLDDLISKSGMAFEPKGFKLIQGERTT